MGVNIEVKSKKYNFSAYLKEKVNFVVGDSGKGKSTLARVASDVNEAVTVIISNGFELGTITTKGFNSIVKKAKKHIDEGSYKDFKAYWSKSENFPYFDQILIVDDADFISSPVFANFVNADRYNYYIIINRTQLSRIGYSVDSVFEFKADGKEHYLQKRYHIPERNLPCKFDIAVTEGVGSDYQFISALFRNTQIKVVTPTLNAPKGHEGGGRSNVVKMLKRNIGLLQTKAIFLLVDYSAFGSNIEYLFSECERIGLDVSICSRLLSFEYLLLKTNLISDTELETFINDNLLSFSTLEQLFTARLEQLTRGTLYSYGKSLSDFPACFYKPCCDIDDYRKELCDKRMLFKNKDKFEVLLRGTEFEFLLDLRDFNK